MLKAKPDFEKLRLDFPMLKCTMHDKPLIYFDNAATTQKPQVVIDTINDFYQKKYGTVHRAIYDLCVFATQEYEATREKVRSLLNASKTTEIIYTRGTTDSINLVARSFGQAFIRPNDEIIVSEMEHHSNIVPWQMLCKERGAHLKVIPINSKAEINLDTYAKLLNSNTKLVCIGHIANSTGTVNPVKEMIAMAHDKGAKCLIDGAQSVPHMKVDVQDLNADFYAFSGHKLYGPTGIGILYGKEALLNEMPPHQGGGDMVSTVSFAETIYNDPPLKFEAGTPMIAEVLGLGSAVDYIAKIGLDNIHQKDQELLHYATKLLREVKDLRIIGEAQEKGAIISFNINGLHHLDIGTMLDLKGIAIRTGKHCAHPTMDHFGISGTCRVSFAFYNTIQEIDLFITALNEVIASLR